MNALLWALSAVGELVRVVGWVGVGMSIALYQSMTIPALVVLAGLLLGAGVDTWRDYRAGLYRAQR